MYFYIKNIHIVCAVLSITGFFIRGVWMIKSPDMLSRSVVKILPHVIDAILLTTAFILVFMSKQYPFYDDWLTVKVLMLVLYIFLGMLAFKWAQTIMTKIVFLLLAMTAFFYIVSVAITKAPLWFVV